MDKQHIIGEIIRTPKENNGTPLGIHKFEKETGIKKTDWYGKFWARWGEAIMEAGFVPNKLQSAYDENWLIEQVILLIRELNKFPTAADIRLKSFNTPNFPNDKTIRRLGAPNEMANKIIAYCKDNSHYQDVLEICNKRLASFDRKDTQKYQKTDVEIGYVYLMKSGSYYKIGNSKNVERRNYEIGIKLPEKFEIIHKIKTTTLLA